MRPQTKKAGKPVKKKLEEIYRDENGNIPDLSKIQNGETGGGQKFMRWMLFLIIFTALGGWLFAKGGAGKTFDESGVRLAIEGPAEAANGGEIEYKISWTAASGSALKNTRLLLNYPRGFIFKESDIESQGKDKNAWAWESGEPQYLGAVKIKGAIFGNSGQEQTLRAFLNYEPANFASTFQRAGNFSTKISGEPIDISIEAPDSVMEKSSAEMRISITNLIEKPLEGLILSYPKSGGISAAFANEKGVNGLEKDEKIVDSEEGLTLGAIKPLQKISIPFIVSLDGSAEEANAVFELKKKINNETYVISREEKRIAVEKNTLDIKTIANGSETEVLAHPGENISFTLFYENKSDKAVKDAKIVFTLDSPSADSKSIFDWTKLEETRNAKISGKQINQDTRRAELEWDSKSIPELAKINPGEKGSIIFSIPVKSDPYTLDSYNGFSASTNAGITAKLLKNEQTANSNSIAVTLNSDLNLDATAKKETENFYLVSFKLTNTWHPLENVIVKTKIFGAGGIEPPASISAGSINYNTEISEITWTIQNMPLEADVLVLNFKVNLSQKNPTQTALTDKIIVSAKDTVTGKTITDYLSELPLN